MTKRVTKGRQEERQQRKGEKLTQGKNTEMRGTEEDGTRKYTDVTDNIGQAGWHVCLG